MTVLLYYDDAYQREFDAIVTAVDLATGKTRVVLDRTAFYPGGGGQLVVDHGGIPWGWRGSGEVAVVGDMVAPKEAISHQDSALSYQLSAVSFSSASRRPSS